MGQTIRMQQFSPAPTDFYLKSMSMIQEKCITSLETEMEKKLLHLLHQNVAFFWYDLCI